MTVVRETKLPGVGVRHEFNTSEGATVAVIVHHDGRREILAYDEDDPDAAASLLSLSVADTQTMAEILGVSQVSETVAEVRQEIDALTIEWIDLPPDSEFIGLSIGSGRLRTRTGASIVAVIRDGQPVPSPEAHFVLQVHDIVVAVGPSDGLTSLRHILAD